MVITFAEHEVSVCLLDFVVNLERRCILKGSQLGPVYVLEEFVVFDFTDASRAESEGGVLAGAVADKLFALFRHALYLILKLYVLLNAL